DQYGVRCREPGDENHDATERHQGPSRKPVALGSKPVHESHLGTPLRHNSETRTNRRPPKANAPQTRWTDAVASSGLRNAWAASRWAWRPAPVGRGFAPEATRSTVPSVEDGAAGPAAPYPVEAASHGADAGMVAAWSPASMPVRKEPSSMLVPVASVDVAGGATDGAAEVVGESKVGAASASAAWLAAVTTPEMTSPTRIRRRALAPRGVFWTL